MKYDLIYKRLIGKGLRENYCSDVYYEKHHIIPRCLGGTDDSYNIVNLTPEQHFVAHQLLVKIFPGKPGLIYAAHMMGSRNTRSKRNNKSYGWLKRKFAKTMSDERKGVPISEQHRANIKRGYKPSEKQKAAVSHSNKTRVYSKKQRIILSDKAKEMVSKRGGFFGKNNPNFKKLTSQELKLLNTLYQEGYTSFSQLLYRSSLSGSMISRTRCKRFLSQKHQNACETHK